MLTVELFEELEGPPEPTLIDALRDFLPIAVRHLKLKHLPKIKLLRDVDTEHMSSFGKFSNEDRIVHVDVENRHPNDVLRTLAHELTHYAQGEQDRLDADSGRTGSTIEDEANAEAGVIMREFNQQFPQYMELEPIILPETWTKKYKKSINCSNPKGFSQKAHCAARRARQAGRKTKSKSVSEAVEDFNPNQVLDQISKNIDQVLQRQQTTPTLDVVPITKLTKDAVRKLDPKSTIGKYFTLLHNQVYRVAQMQPTAGSRSIGTAGMEARHALAGIKRDTIPAIQQLLTQSVKENFADGKGPGRPGDSQRHGIPKGFSQKAHCDARRARQASKKTKSKSVSEQQLDEKCWPGYHKEGNKKMFGKTYPNCVKNKKSNEGVAEDARIARKPGQPAKSKQHSDLYTDEDPRGTITGLKFATVEDARASVAKIRRSGRSHAHKIQAAVAMEQRAKAAGKASAAAVYRKYINANKKTK